MRIPNSTFASGFISQLQGLTSRQSQYQNQIASGQRITDPSDDPAAMGRVLQYNGEKQEIRQFARNNDRAHNISQASFSALKGLKDISDRAGELGVLGTSTAGGDALKAYGTEAEQMVEQALQVANTKYAGEHLFAGTKSDAAPFTATRDANGKITAIAYNGAASGAQIRTSEGTTISPFTSGGQNQQMADFMNNLVALRDALQSGSSSGVGATQTALNNSEDNLLVTISDIGAKQTRLESDRVQNEARFAELENLTGSEADADLAQSAVKLTQAQTAYQAALQSGAKTLSLTLLDYIR